MNPKIIPPDSILYDWTNLGRFMEVPYSYLLAVALSDISAILQRNVWFEMLDVGIIYPTLSVILIGPTGIGKDTAINMGKKRILDEFVKDNWVQPLTTEGIARQLYDIATEHPNTPATMGYILANELKAFLGEKDYQSGMIPFLTAIMSEGVPEYKHGTKNKPFTVPNPTVVLQAGSTEEWFHQLPKGTLEGGFIPRCLVVVERNARAFIPLPQNYLDFEDRQQRAATIARVGEVLHRMVEIYHTPREITMTEDAQHPYMNWYHNRYKLVSPLAKGYAHRARGHVAKMAMISAACRGKTIIDLVDVTFAMEVMNRLIGTLERVILPPTEEGRACVAIRELLPATTADLIVTLRPKFQARILISVLNILQQTKEIVEKGGVWVDNSPSEMV